MKKKKWIVVVIVIALVALVGFNVFAISRTKTTGGVATSQEQTVKVEKKTISDTILASGTVVAADEEVLSFDPTKGTLAEVKVSVGQKVSPGTVLYRYKSPEMEMELSSLQNADRRLQYQADEQKRQLADVDNRINAAKANKQPQEAIDVLNRERQQIASQMKLSEFDRQDQQFKKDSINKKMAELTVKSTISGTVTEVNKKIGTSKDAVSQTVVRIVSDSPFKIEGTVSEYDLVRLSVGQDVVVKAKVYQDRQWKGKIEKVMMTPAVSMATPALGNNAAGGGNNESVTNYPYSVTLEESAGLAVGFHVNIEIQTTAKTTLVVPFESIQKSNGKEYVWVVNEKNAREKREVKTGISNDTYKEIVEGVKEGDRVLTNPPQDPLASMGMMKP